jgi:hypothetical protein
LLFLQLPAPATTTPKNGALLHFLVRRLLPARIAKLLRFHPFGMLLLILRSRVVAVFAIAALQRNDFAHESKSLQIFKNFKSFLLEPPKLPKLFNDLRDGLP